MVLFFLTLPVAGWKRRGRQGWWFGVMVIWCEFGVQSPSRGRSFSTCFWRILVACGVNQHPQTSKRLDTRNSINRSDQPRSSWLRKRSLLLGPRLFQAEKVEAGWFSRESLEWISSNNGLVNNIDSICIFYMYIYTTPLQDTPTIPYSF